MFWQTIDGIAFVILVIVLSAAAAAILTAFIMPVFGKWAVIVAMTLVITLGLFIVYRLFNRKPEPSGYPQ